MKLVIRIGGVLSAALLALNLCFWGAVVHAAPFFTHINSVSGLSLYGESGLDPDAAEARLQAAARILAQSPLGPPEGDFRAFVTNGDWRTRLYFAPVPRAGGVAYYPFSRRNVFLSGADLNADVLIKGEYRITPPRTMTYYLVHEFTHLRIGELTGPIAYHRLPKWIMEGICDLVALGPMSDAEIGAVTAWSGTPLARMQASGSYPLARAAVSFSQSHLGLDPKALISQPMRWDDIAAQMADAGFEGVTSWR